MKPHDMEDRLRRLVESLEPLRPIKVILFGSAARGEDDQMSDLDVVVVAEEIAPRFLDRIGEALALIGADYALDILVYSPTEYANMIREGNPLLESVQREGRLLYERPAA